MKSLVLPAVIGLLVVCAVELAVAQGTSVAFTTGNATLANSVADQSLSVTLPVTNSGSATADNVQLAAINLATATRLSPTLFPVSVGQVTSSATFAVAARFSTSSLVPGQRYLLSVAGNYLEGGIRKGFAVNRYLQIPNPAGAQVTIHTFHRDPTAPNGRGAPFGAGVLIRINDAVFGVTDSNGAATYQVAPGLLAIDARNYPGEQGGAEITIQAGTAASLDILLDDGAEIEEPTTLSLDQASQGLVPATYNSLTFRFRNDQATVAFAHLDFVSFEYLSGTVSRPVDVSGSFVVSNDGTISCTDLPAIRSLIQSHPGGIQVEIGGTDTSGYTHHASTVFRVAQFQVTGALRAPPSNPNLPLGGLFVTAEVLQSEITLQATTDIQGNFSFPLLPPGNVRFHAVAMQNGQTYTADATVAITGNVTLSATLRGIADLSAGVQAFTESSKDEPRVADTQLLRQRLTSLAKIPRIADRSPKPPQPDEGTANISVTSTQQNLDVTQAAVVVVPQGTAEVHLRYMITSTEYPQYVLTQSVFNDRWAVRLLSANGTTLFDKGQQVNAQVSSEPVWITGTSPGQTAQIEKIVNVSSLTTNASANLTLFGSVTNVGDAAFPTTVAASVSVDPPPTVDAAESDSFTYLAPANGKTITKNPPFFSIPRQGETNDIKRKFTLTITKPAGAQLTRVQAKLTDGPGNTLITVVDQAPGGDAVTEINPRTVRVRVSPNMGSPLNTQPPPKHQLKYQFKITVRTPDNTELESSWKASSVYKGLWRRPMFPTYPNVYGDWVTQGTFNWAQGHSSLITALNDSSAEHGGEFPPHGKTGDHTDGHGFDMYHYYPAFAPGISGTAAYNSLVAAFQDAVSGSPTASASRNKVIAWVSQTRSKFDQLAASPEVRVAFYVNGDPNGKAGPPQTWAPSLLRSGSTTVNGQSLITGLGAWTSAGNAIYRPLDGHNNHIHLGLNSRALNEQ